MKRPTSSSSPQSDSSSTEYVKILVRILVTITTYHLQPWECWLFINHWKRIVLAIIASTGSYASRSTISMGSISAPQCLPFGGIHIDFQQHQHKTFPSGRNGCVRVDALRQSRQRHPGGGLLRARRQYNASRCISPSDRRFAVSSRSVGLLF